MTKGLPGWTGNALVAAVVAALVAGLISLLVTHVQDDSTASQAASSQQVQAAQELETAASSLYQGTTDIYNFQRECAGVRNTWADCASEALQVYPNYNSLMTVFSAAGSNIADQTAAQLANQLGSESGGMLGVKSAADANKLWYDMVTTYAELIERCGQLVQTQ